MFARAASKDVVRRSIFRNGFATKVAANNVEVVPEVACVQTVDILEGGGVRSFLGRVTRVGDKVTDLSVDDLVLPADSKHRALGYNTLEAPAQSFLKVDDDSWLDTEVGATLAGTPSAAVHLLSTKGIAEGSTVLATCDQSPLCVDLVRFAKARGLNMVCAVDDARSRQEYTRTVHALYSAGADVVVPNYMVGSSTYAELLEGVGAPTTLIHGGISDYKTELAAFKKAKGFSARKTMLEDLADAGILDDLKVSKELGNAIGSNGTVVAYDTALSGLAYHDWMAKCKNTDEIKAVLSEAVAFAPMLDYEFDHCQDFETSVDMVSSNYRAEDFERVVVMSVDGDAIPRGAPVQKRSAVAEAIMRELGQIDPDHPLVVEAEEAMILREHTRKEVRKVKGSRGFEDAYSEY